MTLFRDLQFGVRMLLKGRAVSAIILVTLALTIGITSTMVSLVGAVLVHPFPDVKEPGLWMAGLGGTAGLCLALLMGTARQRAGVHGLSPGWLRTREKSGERFAVARHAIMTSSP